MNQRRKLLTALGASLFTTSSFSVNAQVPIAPSGKPWRVGILPGGPLAPRKFQWDAFRARMQELGYIEGKNVQFEFRAPEKEGDPYDTLAAELVRLNVDVIVATAGIAITAANKATQRIPIVMCPSADPVIDGFVTSLRRPGGNLTGVAILPAETTGKRLQLLREMVPKAKRVAFLWSTVGKTQLDAAESAARQLGVQLQSLEVNTANALPGAFEAAIKSNADALMVAQTTFTFGMRKEITAMALKHRLPSIYGLPSNAVEGGLMSYGPDDTEFYRLGAMFVDKIFRGSKPGDLPIQQPTRFELVINLKTARALGIKVPQMVLVQAARVIE